MKKLIALCWIVLGLAAMPVVASDASPSIDPTGAPYHLDLDLR